MPKKTEQKPTLRVEFHWTGNIPRAIKKHWEAMFKPRTIILNIPPTKKKG